MKNRTLWGPLANRYEKPAPRKMLALDGGGIRGVLTLALLKEIENKVKKPLHEYFDYIAGTSTGAIIAAGLARGMRVQQLIDFYIANGPAMFQRSKWLQLLNSLYQNGALQKQLQQVFGEQTNLRPEYLKTLLLVVTRNVTTDSPWPISSNPEARYNNLSKGSNMDIPLWQLVRASTAAPIYFPPEIISVVPGDPSKDFVFVDGGVTPYNNPAYVLYRFATEPAYRLEWPTGENKLLLISVGTGSAASPGATAQDGESNIASIGLGIPGTLMYASAVDQDINCRTTGRCVYGDVIDRELLDLIPRQGDDTGTYDERLARPLKPLQDDMGRAFRYARYNADLSPEGLKRLGIPEADATSLTKMDNATPENIQHLLAVGTAAARQIDAAHFAGFE